MKSPVVVLLCCQHLVCLDCHSKYRSDLAGKAVNVIKQLNIPSGGLDIDIWLNIFRYIRGLNKVDAVEKVQIKFYEYILEMGPATPNQAVLEELDYQLDIT